MPAILISAILAVQALLRPTVAIFYAGPVSGDIAGMELATARAVNGAYFADLPYGVGGGVYVGVNWLPPIVHATGELECPSDAFSQADVTAWLDAQYRGTLRTVDIALIVPPAGQSVRCGGNYHSITANGHVLAVAMWPSVPAGIWVGAMSHELAEAATNPDTRSPNTDIADPCPGQWIYEDGGTASWVAGYLVNGGCIWPW